jgi:hypothetical protein
MHTGNDIDSLERKGIGPWLALAAVAIADIASTLFFLAALD